MIAQNRYLYFLQVYEIFKSFFKSRLGNLRKIVSQKKQFTSVCFLYLFFFLSENNSPNWIISGRPRAFSRRSCAREACVERETCTFTDQISVKRQQERDSLHIHAAARPVAPHQTPSGSTRADGRSLSRIKDAKSSRLKRKAFPQVKRVILKEFRDLWQCDHLYS